MAKKKGENLEKSVPGITDESGSDGSSPVNLDKPSLGSAPTPAEAEAAAKKEPAEQPPKPARNLPSVPVRVYAALSGLKPDKIKSFVAWVQREELRPCPVPEWKDRYQQFLNRPIRPAR